MGKRSLNLSAIAGLLLMLGPAAASAEARDCWSLTAETRKVLYGTPAQQDGGQEPQLVLLARAFATAREGQAVERALVEVVHCMDEAQLSVEGWKQIVEERYRINAVLEVRSVLKAAPAAGGEPVAVIQYASIPTLMFHMVGETDATGVVTVEIPIDPREDFVFALVRPVEVDALIAAGLGLLSLDEGETDYARAHLCRAALSLGEVLKAPTGRLAGGERRSLEQVRSYVVKVLEAAVGGSAAVAAALAEVSSEFSVASLCEAAAGGGGR